MWHELGSGLLRLAPWVVGGLVLLFAVRVGRKWRSKYDAALRLRQKLESQAAAYQRLRQEIVVKGNTVELHLGSDYDGRTVALGESQLGIPRGVPGRRALGSVHHEALSDGRVHLELSESVERLRSARADGVDAGSVDGGVWPRASVAGGDAGGACDVIGCVSCARGMQPGARVELLERHEPFDSGAVLSLGRHVGESEVLVTDGRRMALVSIYELGRLGG